MINVGVTGQSGFIGYHLFHYLKLMNTVKLIPFEDEYFENGQKIDSFVSQCDTIVHLAALNRHGEQGVIYKTNVELVEKLISSIKRIGNKPHVIMSSSTQEDRNNEYGNSKKKGRELLSRASEEGLIDFSGLLIPNVFGPFGTPFYNSFISTFSYQIINEDQPTIEIDANINLIYIQDLVEYIYRTIIGKSFSKALIVPHIATAKVSEVLDKMYYFKDIYYDEGSIPDITNYFDLCLFNTFRSYISPSYYPKNYKVNMDNRGAFVEITKSLSQGQTSYSLTKPDITRGNHFHTRKVERFAVIRGEALIQLRKIGTKKVIEYNLTGNKPAYIDMPVWYTHSIKNIGKTDLLTIFWINEFYDPKDPDTYFEEV
jgi:UDP-2-acetamido-2,6-beta-L-arabino-hexul-4-ose reductase